MVSFFGRELPHDLEAEDYQRMISEFVVENQSQLDSMDLAKADCSLFSENMARFLKSLKASGQVSTNCKPGMLCSIIDDLFGFRDGLQTFGTWLNSALKSMIKATLSVLPNYRLMAPRRRRTTPTPAPVGCFGGCCGCF